MLYCCLTSGRVPLGAVRSATVRTSRTSSPTPPIATDASLNSFVACVESPWAAQQGTILRKEGSPTFMKWWEAPVSASLASNQMKLVFSRKHNASADSASSQAHECLATAFTAFDLVTTLLRVICFLGCSRESAMTTFPYEWWRKGCDRHCNFSINVAS